MSLVEEAWKSLGQVLDPEMPYVSIVDLGIVRHIVETDACLEVILTPTFSACPAMAQMLAETETVLKVLTAKRIHVAQQLAPAWSSDWISEAGQAKLLAAGIVPPATRHEVKESQAVHFHPRAFCPQCGSKQTQLLSAFSATSCKAMYRCQTCLEPFEVIKTI